jgi:site-specific DNA-methyltransferase (adenine-specific)
VNSVHHAPALELLGSIETGSIDMIYTDPPFGTNLKQKLDRKKKDVVVSSMEYDDKQDDYLEFMRSHIEEFHRVLKESGTMYLHLDHHWVHYVKVMCDEIFDRENFLSEVIWAYDFGGRGKDKWPAKHDSILVYTKSRGKHIFNWEDIDRIPYMAPELQKDPERAAKGKVPTSVWWMSIVGTASKERTGYPNQKPQKLMERAIVASSPLGGVVLDPFAGSGTTAAAALAVGRTFITSDANIVAIDVMKERFAGQEKINFILKSGVEPTPVP